VPRIIESRIESMNLIVFSRLHDGVHFSIDFSIYIRYDWYIYIYIYIYPLLAANHFTNRIIIILMTIKLRKITVGGYVTYKLMKTVMILEHK